MVTDSISAGAASNLLLQLGCQREHLAHAPREEDLLHAPVVTGAEEPAARIKNRASLFEQRCEIFELDADCEEALWAALDQSRHGLDCHATA